MDSVKPIKIRKQENIEIEWNGGRIVWIRSRGFDRKAKKNKWRVIETT